MSDICPHDDDPATCPPCRRQRGADRPLGHTAPTVEFAFTARYEGACGACGLPVYVGQSCAHLSDGTNVHRGCA